jgi:hypothetical protein
MEIHFKQKSQYDLGSELGAGSHPTLTVTFNGLHLEIYIPWLRRGCA